MQKCWDQDPLLRPEMRGILQDLVSSLLQSLHNFDKSSLEFQIALNQFYDSTERKRCIRRLCGAELEDFVNLLDNVRPFFNRFHLIPVMTCCIGVKYQWVRWQVATANIARPTGGVWRAGHTSEIPHDSSSNIQVDPQTWHCE